MRLIDGDRLKAVLARSVEGVFGIDALSLLIDAQPTIDSVKHGKWINTYGDTPYDPRDRNYWWHCSECGESASTPFKSRYCPRCGAKMGGEEE